MRSFPESKALLEKLLRELQSKCAAQISSTPSGGSIVRVRATIGIGIPSPQSPVMRFFLPRAAWKPISSTGCKKRPGGRRRPLSRLLSQSRRHPRVNINRRRPNWPPPCQCRATRPEEPNPKLLPPGSPSKLGNPLTVGHMASLATHRLREKLYLHCHFDLRPLASEVRSIYSPLSAPIYF
jgi:hypothetical protein